MRTYLLYHFLAPHDFSVWASTNSSIFLMLLWLDCGLRKSIPRYAPLFGTHTTRITRQVIIFQLTIQLLALPVLLWFLIHTIPLLLIALATCTYLAQGANSIMRLMYHSYFRNKAYNLIDTAITLLETSMLCSMIFYTPSHTILILTFATQTAASMILAILSYHLFIPPDRTAQQGANSDQFSYRPFIKHSLIMWTTTIIKSISERNFLLLLLTHTTGVATANLFKIANDTALFFYRIIIKTIGVADTALLAHVHAEHQEGEVQNRMMMHALKEVIAKMARLILPVLGGIVISCFFRYWVYQAIVFHAFLIMAVGYVCETVLLPYERFLEVNQKYLILFLSYVPYVVVMVLLILTMRVTSIGFVSILLIVHSVRLVSYLLIRLFVYMIYRI